jgi:hypothetical protein
MGARSMSRGLPLGLATADLLASDEWDTRGLLHPKIGPGFAHNAVIGKKTASLLNMITTEPQLKDYLSKFLTFVRNDIEQAALSGTSSPSWVSSRTHVRDLVFLS